MASSREEEDDTTVYKPENEEGWRMYTDKEGAYFGIPTANLVELGEAIAEDPRFVDCAVRTAWEGLTQRDYTDADWSEFQRLRDAFEASELSVRHLTRSIVMSDEYRVKNVEDDELSERLSGVKVVNPYQLSNVIEHHWLQLDDERSQYPHQSRVGCTRTVGWFGWRQCQQAQL